MNDVNQLTPIEKTKEIILLSKTNSLSNLLKVYKISRSLFYYHKKKLNEDKYARTKLLIEYIFNSSKGRYGYRRIKYALMKKFNIQIAYKTVRKLMKELGLVCQVKRPSTHYATRVPKKVVNIINRDFSSPEPNYKWVTDVTEFRIAKQRLYLSVIKDLYNMEIVGYSISRHNDWKLVLNSLEKCSNEINLENVILHSDQGIIYQTQNYKDYLNEHNFIQSMSRKGNCYDNAPAESFFGTLKSETIYLNHVHNLDELIKTITGYIHWYNNERISLKLGGFSPVEYRNRLN